MKYSPDYRTLQHILVVQQSLPIIEMKLLKFTRRVQERDPIDTIDRYLKADILLIRESGNIKKTVVTTAYTALKIVTPQLGEPVKSEDTPKSLQHITNSLVTKQRLRAERKLTDYLVRETDAPEEDQQSVLKNQFQLFATCNLAKF